LRGKNTIFPAFFLVIFGYLKNFCGMKILWVNSGLGKTFSNTRLYGIPPVLKSLGDENRILIAGRAETALPKEFVPLPVPGGRLGAYRLLVTLLLPFLCLKYRPDIVLTDWMSATLTRGVVLFKRLGWLGCKLVHDVRTVPVKEDGGKSLRVYATSLEYAKAHFQGLTTITEPLREEIHARFGIDPGSIAVWTSGVDPDHFQPQDASRLRRELGLEDKYVVFYHGSVNQNRGVVELALSAQYLRDRAEVRILILGGGNEWGRLQQMVRDHRLEQVILMPGVPYARIPDWIACADLCVVPLPDHPWWRVSSPLKLMEYLAMGKPVLLTEMQAHRAVVPSDEDAFYVSGNDPRTLAEGIRRALEKRSIFAEMGARGRRLAVERLTWGGQAQILRSYLLRVLNGEIHLRR
jgi:glycosyltransferase involved in cell wall biosynthesis